MYVVVQVVFRKIADVQREKELAERDTPLELSTDHPVRRLISRFRKMSCSRLPSISAGVALTEMSPGDTPTTVPPPQRNSYSVDCCTTHDNTADTTNNNCTLQTAINGAGQSQSAARSRMLSADAATAATAAALPSNNALNMRRTEAGNSEERVLLCDNMVPRTPRRSKWASLLSRVVPADTSGAVSPVPVADNEVFDVEDSDPVSSSPAVTQTTAGPPSTVEVHVTRDDSSSSAPRHDDTRHSVDTVRRVDTASAGAELTELRCEVSRQLCAVNERIDDVSQRLDVIVRLLANTSPQRRPSNLQALAQFR